MTGRVTELLAAGAAAGPDEVTEAFWQACHAGQRRTAELLLEHGADINGSPGYSEQLAVDVAAGPDTRRSILRDWLIERGAVPTTEQTD